MLQVMTNLGQSTIAGIGLFATEYIPKGTVIWQYNRYTTNSYPETEWEDFKKSVSEIAFKGIERFAHFHEGTWNLNLDDTRFINHSSTPNVSNDTEKGVSYALQDIKRGDELTVDYSVLCKSDSAVCEVCGICKLD